MPHQDSAAPPGPADVLAAALGEARIEAAAAARRALAALATDDLAAIAHCGEEAQLALGRAAGFASLLLRSR